MAQQHIYITQYNVFKLFKYVIYLLLTLNIFLFLHEEFNASIIRFSDGIDLLALYQAMPATLDTLAWVILLLLFELETSVFEDRTLKGPRLWTIHGVRLLCYLVIFTAFWGYLSKLGSLMLYSPVDALTACQVAGQLMLIDMNEYIAITADNCAEFGNTPLLLHSIDQTYTNDILFENILWLAWADILNSATWMLVCLVLEFDVYLQLNHNTNQQLLSTSRGIKMILYGVLFWAAMYWGYTGSLLDFWDAFLWLVAFFLIELNLIDWQTEVQEAQDIEVSEIDLPVEVS